MCIPPLVWTKPPLALPYAAGVVLGARDDGVPLVIEGAAEDLVRVALQHLSMDTWVWCRCTVYGV